MIEFFFLFCEEEINDGRERERKQSSTFFGKKQAKKLPSISNDDELFETVAVKKIEWRRNLDETNHRR